MARPSGYVVCTSANSLHTPYSCLTSDPVLYPHDNMALLASSCVHSIRLHFMQVQQTRHTQF